MLATKTTELIHPKYLTGNSIALRTVGPYAPLAQSNRHATAAIADFHCHGDGWAWNRRPGAWFRIPQYEGCIYPELELPRAGEDAICPPMATVTKNKMIARDSFLYNPSALANRDHNEKEATDRRKATDGGFETVIETSVGVDREYALSLLLSPPMNAMAATRPRRTWPSPRGSEYSPRKFSRGNPTTGIPGPLPSESPVLEHGMGSKGSRKQDSAVSWPLTQNRASEGELHRGQQSPSPSRERIKTQRQQQHARDMHLEQPRPLRRACHHQGNEEEERRGLPCMDSSGNANDSDDNEADDDAGGNDCNEISVDELKKRLSQLIGLSLTELERLLDGSQCKTTTAAAAAGVE